MTEHDQLVAPEEEGRQAARARKDFAQCPYTYANSGCVGMDDYAASGNNRKRDLWFSGWKDEKQRLGLDHRMQPNARLSGAGTASA